MFIIFFAQISICLWKGGGGDAGLNLCVLRVNFPC